MNSSQLNVLKMENQHEFDCVYLEDQFQRILDELPSLLSDGFQHYSLPSSFEFDADLFMYQNKNLPHFVFKDFEDFSSDSCMWDDNPPSFYEGINAIDTKPLNATIDCFDHFENAISELSEVPAEIRREFTSLIKHEVGKKQIGRLKSSTLELDEIQKHFHLPITKASKEMKVGLTVLKKRCRELNIMRWPHRKIKSLKSLINNVKELGLTKEIEMLEEHKRMLEQLPEMELTERTKKLRQACFKANYKKRRSLASLA